MRFTSKLLAQHIGWTFKKHWHIQGKRIPYDTGAKAELEKLNIKVRDVTEVISPPKLFEKIDMDNLIFENDENESPLNIHEETCYVYGNSIVPLEGMPQAQILTKSIVINEFPKKICEIINKMKISSTVNKNIQNAILASHILDAEQEKLPVVKLPERPAYVLPRTYGITNERTSRLLTSKLIFECEKLAGHSLNYQRKIFKDANFQVVVTKDGEKIQYNLSAETLITSKRPIEPLNEKYNDDLPDLYPLKHTITIPKKKITVNNFYPISNNLTSHYPHIMLIHFSPHDVQNLHETPVTQTQFQSRTLLKAFTLAASKAKQIYGDNVKSLPKPIVVQSVQTDGKVFHFGIFQLNTLDLDDLVGTKNYWFHVPCIDLFSKCEYKTGRPILEGYNKDVMKYLNAFYNNC